jgi:hypothetical protein
MSDLPRAALSIAVAIAAVMVVLAHPSTGWDVIGGVVVAVALLVFIQAIMSVAGESGTTRR